MDGDVLSTSLANAPTHGVVTLAADGSFVYTPAADFHGSDAFQYLASDGRGGSTPATVALTVSGVNDAPVAVADAFTTAEDTPLFVTAPGVLANDTDADGDSLTASLVAVPTYGTLVLAASGGFEYTPAPGYGGSDAFTYEVSDGLGGTATGTVTLTVTVANDAPLAADDAYGTDEDVPLQVAAPGVLGNDGDPDGDALTATVATGPANGSLLLNADGSFTFTPAPDWSGKDTFTYTADDGHGGTAAGTVTLTIEAVNDAPVAADDAYGTDEDVPLQVAAPGVVGNDGDPDGDVLTATVATGPANGSLLLNADGSFTFTPAPDWGGSDVFTYTAGDGHGGTATGTVALAVTPVNDVPVAVADAYTTAEDTPLALAAPGVLANDTDADGDALKASLVSAPAHGTLVLQASGGFEYTPAPGYGGLDGFSYEMNDGHGGTATGPVTLTIDAVNDVPVVADDAYRTDEDVPLQVAAPGVLGNDADPDGDALTATVATGPTNGSILLNAEGSFTYTPAPDWSGSDAFTYTADDGQGGAHTATVALTVEAVADSLAGGSTATPPAGSGPGAATPAAGVEPAPSPRVLGRDGILVYPNPFNGRTTVVYDLDTTAEVEICIYNARGQRVLLLLVAVQAPGQHEAVWDAKNEAGVEVESGVYFVQLRRATSTVTRRLVLVQ